MDEAKAETSLDFRGRGQGRVRKNGRVWPRPRPIFWILYPIPLSLKMLPTIFRWSTHYTVALGKFYRKIFELKLGQFGPNLAEAEFGKMAEFGRGLGRFLTPGHFEANY